SVVKLVGLEPQILVDGKEGRHPGNNDSQDYYHKKQKTDHQCVGKTEHPVYLIAEKVDKHRQEYYSQGGTCKSVQYALEQEGFSDKASSSTNQLHGIYNKTP